MHSHINETTQKLSLNSNLSGPIVFIHIPKAGGMTIYSAIRSIYKPSEIHKINPAAESLEKYKQLSVARKKNLKVIYGHMDYQIHKFMPSNSRYFTMMRNPIERVISHYYYVKRTANNPLNELAKRSTLEDWITRCGLIEMNNGQTRRLSGYNDPEELSECSEERLNQAKCTIQQQFSLVGITERFDESSRLLKQLFNWPIESVRPTNVSPHRPNIKEIPTQTIQLIKKFNALDIELYEYSAQLLSERLEA